MHPAQLQAQPFTYVSGLYLVLDLFHTGFISTAGDWQGKAAMPPASLQ